MHAEMESDTARCSNIRSKLYCPVMAREARFLETAAPVLDLSAKSAVVMEQEKQGNLICER